MDNNFLPDGPIIAVSSGTGQNVAISVLRLSGFASLEDLAPFLSLNTKKIKARTTHLTKIKYKDEIFDEVILIYYPGPNSYNGENIVELNVHGNQLSVERITQLFVAKGPFRRAMNGEFSFRALKNDKLTLGQVEGLDLLLNSNSPYVFKKGLEILNGELNEHYDQLYQACLRLKSSLEMNIDFADDIGEEEARDLLDNSSQDLFRLISNLKDMFENGDTDLLDPKIVLFGEVNSGKSSLFNQILGKNRAIISTEEGTTRDFISESFNINGINFRLVDTAGIRDGAGAVEEIGIERSIEQIEKSFFKILVINPFNQNYKLQAFLDKYNFDLIVFTHFDLEDASTEINNLPINIDDYDFIKGDVNFEKAGSIGPKLEGNSGSIGPENHENPGSIGPESMAGSIGPKNSSGSIGPKNSSGSIGPIEGNDEDNVGPIGPEIAGQCLQKVTNKYNSVISTSPIPLKRHKDALNNIYLMTGKYLKLLDSSNDVAIISSELQLIEKEIYNLIGVITPDQVLTSVFSNFCIGK
jgi:tRNA modification GTPase